MEIKEVDDFEPKSLIITNDGKIDISIFRGVYQTPAANKGEEVLFNITDEEYLKLLSGEIESEIKANKDNSDITKKKFGKNMKSLRAKGFNTNSSGQVEFPYVIKVRVGGFLFSEDKYFILKSVTQSKKMQTKGFNPKRLIQPGEVIAQGIGAVYEPIERKGSPKTFKLGAMFDPIPDTKAIRKRYAFSGNTEQYNPITTQEMTEEDLLNYSIRSGIPMSNLKKKEQSPIQKKETGGGVVRTNTGSRSPKQILLEEYGINMKLVPGKGIVFEGDLYDDVVKTMGADAKNIRTPNDLLKILNYQPYEKPNKIQESKIFKEGDVFTEDDFMRDTFERAGFEEVTEEELLRLMNKNNPLNDKCSG
jgi:hypothetical protein